MTGRNCLSTDISNRILCGRHVWLWGRLGVGLGRGRSVFADERRGIRGLFREGGNGLGSFGGSLSALSAAWLTKQTAELRGRGLFALTVGYLAVRNSSRLLLLFAPQSVEERLATALSVVRRSGGGSWRSYGGGDRRRGLCGGSNRSRRFRRRGGNS